MFETSDQAIAFIIEWIRNCNIQIRYFSSHPSKPPVFRIDLKTFDEAQGRTVTIQKFYGDTLVSALNRCVSHIQEMILEREKSLKEENV